ncbi:MAG: HD domain-containing protein [Candidatus Nezhaarchaeales archaeon]
MESFILELREAIASDITKLIPNKIETGVYGYALPCNPKSYLISGLQHFFGAAFIAARLAEFSEMSEYEQATAFLAGLLHDYEKMRLSLQILKEKADEVFANERLYDVLDGYLGGRFDDALEVASKLESGGLPRRLQVIAEFVRLGDYLTGGEESWNIAYVMDKVGETLSKLGVKHHLVPVVIGKQRPIIAIVAEKLNEILMEAELTPLVSTPTGSLYLSRSCIGGDDIKKLYDGLANYISNEVTKALAPTTTSKPKVASLRSVDGIVHAGDKKLNTGRVISSLPNLRQLSISDIEETFRTYTTPADKVLLVIWSVLTYAKTLGSVKENLREALSELELGFIRGKDVQEVIKNLSNHLNEFGSQDLSNLVERTKDKLVKRMLSAEVDVSDVKEVVEKTISIRYFGITGSAQKRPKEGAVCVICRERVSKTRTLRAYLDRFKRILDINVSELFHPDRQGRPDDYRALEGFSDSVPICPVCEYESIIFPATTSFFDGMWASNIIYYPAMSTDLLQIVREVAREYVVLGLKRKKKEETKPLVIPDYVSSRIIVKTSDERGRLGKGDLLTALDLWYYIGGSLVLTTNALSMPPPWSGLPIEMEVSDVVMEESVLHFVRELKIARERNEWSRTRRLRRILYEQLRTYVMNLDEAEVKIGKTRFTKSGLITTGAPALDVYSYMLRKLM